MKNKKLRSVISRRVRNYEEWEFFKKYFFNPLLSSPLCVEPAGLTVMLKGKRRGGLLIIDLNKKLTHSIKELLISSGSLRKLTEKKTDI